MIYVFNQLRNILNVKELLTTYYAYVQSILEGGIIAWGGAYKSIIEPLVITQKAIMKAALGRRRRYSTDLLFDEFRVLDIRQLFIKNVLNYLYRHADELFDNITYGYATRNATTLGIRMPRLVKTFSVTNVYYLAHVIYRNIPDNLRQFNCSITTYKTRVKNWLYETGRQNSELLLSSVYR